MLDKFKIPDPSLTGTPPAAFHFMVLFYGMGKKPVPNPLDIRFQSVSGISVSLPEDKIVQRGGFSIATPQKPQYTDLTLKRGFILGNSPLRKELELQIRDFRLCPRNVHVMLLNEQSTPIATWLFFSAYPIQWEISSLDASQSDYVIETMALKYSHFQPVSI